MSPIILKNSHSHSFGWVGDDGVARETTVQRGGCIEGLNIPLKQLTKIMNEYVVTFDGNAERPRYEYSDEVVDADGSTYTSGVITQRIMQEGLKKTGPDAPKPLSQEELTALQRKAEEEERAENLAAENEAVATQAREDAEAAKAETERATAAAAEQAARAEAAEAKVAAMEDAAAAKTEATKTPAPKAKADTKK